MKISIGQKKAVSVDLTNTQNNLWSSILLKTRKKRFKYSIPSKFTKYKFISKCKEVKNYLFSLLKAILWVNKI